jgi:hypothetical protein
MSLPSNAAGVTVNPGPPKSAGTRLNGPRRILVSAGVGAVAFLSLGTFVVRLSAFMIHVQTACAGSHCAYGQLTYTAVAALQRLGLSLSAYAALQITLVLLWAVLCWAVAGIIAWRKSDDWMALLVALLLVLWPTAMVTGAFSLGTYATLQGSEFPNPLVNLLTRFGFFLVFFLFPNGRFVARWTLVPLGVILVEEFSYHFLSFWPLAESGWPLRLAELLWLAMLLSLVPIQWYRYRHLSSAVERQQIKWAALGISIVTVGFVVRFVLTLLNPTLNEPGSLYNTLSTLVLLYVSLVIPLSIGLAILRYRLWDVDVLINKALVYGLLTGTLAAVYAGLIIGLESLVGQFSAQSAQPLVIVISTLAIAALFQPLRRRIQHLIDRRFYRKKYDAAKTLDAFSTTLRNEVNLEQLRAQLIAVVNETMQPGHVSLWLRSPERYAGTPSKAAGTKGNRSERPEVINIHA